ncbi:MAG: imidazole glycerol phosphate synthase subunit HisH [Verrucomicrobiaceae bacterium]|nr:imidazole glycerol phosphate synthase subunit HisH [Verrucomicrobiaceae bacterium]
MITIIDSGIANIASVTSAFRRLGAGNCVTRQPCDLESAHAIVLPGVGAFADGMESLRKCALIEPVRRAAVRGTPILGICLGMQLLADASEEFGEHAGLGLVPGRVVQLSPGAAGDRVPNIGWCDVEPQAASRVFAGTAPGTAFYFVHSFHFRCADEKDVSASIKFGGASVAVAVERGNVFGVQFHPEKSQDAGLGVLENFVRFAKEVNA